jgi:hypothetical protein
MYITWIGNFGQAARIIVSRCHVTYCSRKAALAAYEIGLFGVLLF